MDDNEVSIRGAVETYAARNFSDFSVVKLELIEWIENGECLVHLSLQFSDEQIEALMNNVSPADKEPAHDLLSGDWDAILRIRGNEVISFDWKNLDFD